MLAGVGHDIRHAVRGLKRSWTFTLVCLISVAFGLAINALLVILIRTTVDPPAAIEAEGAVDLLVTTRGRVQDDVWSYPDFADLQRADVGMEVTGWATGTRNLRTDDGDDGAPVRVMYVSANYFRTLGVDVAPGRAFLPEEDDVTGEPPVVVRHRFWQNRLGADLRVVGRSLNLNGVIHRVIGVTPRGFGGHRAGRSASVWIPLWEHPLLGMGGSLRDDRGADRMEVIGRLHEGTSMAQANGTLDAVMRGLAEAHPSTNVDRGARVVPYAWQGGGRDEVRVVTTLIMTPGVMVLIVMCLNLAGMVLVRNTMRERELALRLALGSSRTRLIRHLVTESALLAFIGAGLGTALSWLPLRWLALRYGLAVPERLDWTLVGLCLGLGLLTTLIIGLAPALRFSRPALLRSIKDDAGGGGRRRSWIHRIATSVQTAVAIPLLVLNAMVLQATRLMDEADYGFEPNRLSVATIDLGVEGYREDEVEPFLRQLRDGVAAIPGVEAVSLADGIPLDYERRNRRITRAGEEAYVGVRTTRVAEAYFETIGTPLLRGRAFDETDVDGAEPVAVVTASLAALLWPGQDALGQHIRYALDRSTVMELTVVGVVNDVAGSSHESEPINLFLPLWQHPAPRNTLVVRAASENPGMAKAIQDVALEIDPDLTRPTVQSSRSLMEAATREIYMGSLFVGVLTVLTLLLAALGVYGVVAFAVACRAREIGIRMAVGATRRRVLMSVLADGAKLAVPGIVVGC
ncbi:MAG: ABC transporter permease, partial [Longimicrobiales bacterium]